LTQSLVWAEVDLDIIAANFRHIKRLLRGSTKLLAVVKADAYGHGALPVARTLAKAGADYLAVATADEALALREGGIELPILVLNTGLPDGQEEVLVRRDITQTVCTPELAAAIDRAARRLQKRGLAHLKVETGMGRLGIGVEEVPAFLRAVASLRGFYLEGIYSHFAVADEDTPFHNRYTLEQYNRFLEALASCSNTGRGRPLAHIANSAAILNYPQYHLDMVRAGCIIYGFYPRGDDKERRLIELLPALSWKTVVVQVGGVTEGKRMALLPVGRSHGLPPAAREVLLAGRRAAVVKVELDHCEVAVPENVEIAPGAEVVLIGRQGEDEISAEEVAGWAGTITEEITCRLGNLPHVFKGGSGAEGSLY